MGDRVHGGHRHQRTGTVGHGEGGQRMGVQGTGTGRGTDTKKVRIIIVIPTLRTK